jgi:hypothetical protein
MSPEEKEELRRLIRKFYAERPATAHGCTAVQFAVAREARCTIPEVEAACAFLLDLGQLRDVPNNLGSQKYFQISAQGTLAHERGE